VGRHLAHPGSELTAAGAWAPPLRAAWYERAWRWARRRLERAPTLGVALPPLLLLVVVLFIRHPATNYIFDEQEALLANPYVNALQELRFLDAFRRDFWGLTPDGSIGSYRPLPNLLWRATWQLGEHARHPFVLHLYNLLVHALNAALLASFVHAASRRRALGWLAGVLFAGFALLTEAVSGIVGLADVLGGLAALAALHALRLPAAAAGPAVFAAVLLGLFSKESALVCVPLVPLAALLLAARLHPERPAPLARALVAFTGALAAFVLYVELRRRWFPSPLPSKLSEPLPPLEPCLAARFDCELAHLRYRAQASYRDLLLWFRQAPLPQDPLNNPLVDADFPERVAGALRVYWRGLVQLLVPVRLSGDYSYPQEPIPDSLYRWESVAGFFAMIVPPATAVGLAIVGRLREASDRRMLVPRGPLADAMRRALGTPALGAPAGPGRARLEEPLVEGEPRRWSAWRIAVGAGACVVASATLAPVLGSEPFPSSVPIHWPVWSGATLWGVVGAGLCVDGWRSPRRVAQPAGAWPWRHAWPPIAALGLVWIVVSYFPHSNIPVLLPTVRAERFWYLPAVGGALLLALLLDHARDLLAGRRAWGGRIPVALAAIAPIFGFQWVQAYRHAMDYRDDLAFWHSTKESVPRSAKAHLNYSVMKGARGDLDTRLAESRIAAELAPDWPMAHVYTGDTLCRMHRPEEAWPHYREGFEIGPNERGLIALALQCLYDEGALERHDEELRAVADKHPGSWIAYLALDTLSNHDKHKGVDPKYRPRGYNEGPKE
jgi:hypothetical protein